MELGLRDLDSDNISKIASAEAIVSGFKNNKY